mgnify:FL=1
MTTTSLPPDTVHVRIVQARAQAAPSAWHIAYEVCNTGVATVWLVDQEHLTLHMAPGHIELSYARSPLRSGVQVFGYFAPQVTPLDAGTCVQREATVEWPCTLSTLWNASSLADPPPGRYTVTVRIGFGATPAPGASQVGDAVDAAVLRWQHAAVSGSVMLGIVMPPSKPGGAKPEKKT